MDTTTTQQTKSISKPATDQSTPAERLEATRPFRRTELDVAKIDAVVRGKVPEWLTGDLVRTCPAMFKTKSWSAAHWFDGLGMLYAFRVGKDGGVDFRQRLLDSAYARAAQSGRVGIASFGTPMQRSAWERLTHPIPSTTDNTNVHILPIGDELVALTEGPTQLSIDPSTLGVRCAVTYEKDTLDGASMLAHAHFDFERDKVVSLATKIGPVTTLTIYEHAPSSRRRVPVAKWQTGNMPYVHAFGLTSQNAVIIDHPLRVNAKDLLWSNGGFIDRFSWKPETGTRFIVLGRDGTTRVHETEAMFVFHIVNTFEEGGATVIDVAAYESASIVENLRVANLTAPGLAGLSAKFLRYVLRPGETRVTAQPLSDVSFEFPQISYRRTNGKPYQFAWGADVGTAEHPLGSLAKINTHTGAHSSFERQGWIFGEPVFVRDPNGATEDAGVLLSVAHARDKSTTAMAVIDAASMQELAWAEVPIDVPLGFHGSFLRAK